jgi:hypothetical protein
MSSADILATITTVQGEKEKYEQLLTKLTNAKIEKKCVIEERNTEGMGGTKYKNQHTQMKQIVHNFVKTVKSEKSAAKEALQAKMKQLDIELETLNTQYKAALAYEAEQRRAALREQARKQAEELKKQKMHAKKIG